MHLDNATLLEHASLCVKCGLCLPHCPTYQATGQENRSPRGRISLMEAYLNGDLAPTQAWTDNIESCLNCGACESMCPTQVPYRLLWVETQAQLPKQPWTARLFKRVCIQATWALRRFFGSLKAG